MSNVSSIKPEKVDEIDAKWAGMSKKVQQSINAWTKEWKRKLIDSHEEIVASVRSSSKQGSFSTTLAVNESKEGGLSGKLSTRVRKAVEDVEMPMHFDRDGQMVLGLDPTISNPEEEGGEEEDDVAGAE